MNDHEGVFCKTEKHWIKTKSQTGKNTVYGPKLGQAQQEKNNRWGAGVWPHPVALGPFQWTAAGLAGGAHAGLAGEQGKRPARVVVDCSWTRSTHPSERPSSSGQSRGRRRGSLAGLLWVAGEVQVRLALDNSDMADEEVGDRPSPAVLSVNGQTSGIPGARTHEAEVVVGGLRWCGA